MAVTEFEEAVRSLEVDDFDWESARALWREQGSLGKLHNLVKFIRSSSQRKEEFRGIRTGGLNTDGKWQSEDERKPKVSAYHD